MGSSKKQTVGYRYYMGMHMGLSHGPVDALLAIEAGGRIAWQGSQTASGTITVNAPELWGGEDREGGVAALVDVMMGAPNQQPNDYLASQQGADQPAYRGLFGVVVRGPSSSQGIAAGTEEVNLGGIITGAALTRPSGLVAANNPYLKPWAFRVRRILQGWLGGSPWYSAKASIDLGGGLLAMNPAHIVYECLTNTEWGLGYPSGQLDLATFTAAADTFHAEGLGLCMAWQQQDSLLGFLQLVMDHAGAVMVQDRTTGLFRLRAVRGDYTLASLPLFGSQAGNVLEVSRIERATYTEAVNEITVAYVDAATGKDGSVTVQQLAAIQAQGAVVPETRQYPGIPTANLALRTAMRDLRAATSGLARITMTVNRTAYSVLPGDVLRFEWLPAGIEEMALRVASVDYGSLTDGAMTLECVEDVFSLPATSYVNPQPGGSGTTTTPQASQGALAIEAPYLSLVRQVGDSSAAATPVDAGYVIAMAPRPAGQPINCALEARVGSGEWVGAGTADWTPTATLAAAITETSTGITLSGISLGASIVVGDLVLLGSSTAHEIAQVSAFDATARTMTLRRGCLDTVPRRWFAGTRLYVFSRIAGNIETQYVDPEVVGVRFRTVASTGTLDATLAPAVTITMDQRQARPYPPGNLTVNGQRFPSIISGALALSWSHRDRLGQSDLVLDQLATSTGPEAGTTYTVRLYGETGTLLRTVTGLTGTTYTWTTEAADSGLGGTEYTTVAWAQSSVYATGLDATASNMRDGNMNTGAGTNNGAEEWIRADLGSAQPVVAIAVAGNSNLPVWGGQVALYLNGSDVQWSNDLTTWTTVASVSGVDDSGALRFVNFASVTARYWRLRRAGYLATTEFRLYSTTGRLNTTVRVELESVRGGLASYMRYDLALTRAGAVPGGTIVPGSTPVILGDVGTGAQVGVASNVQLEAQGIAGTAVWQIAPGSTAGASISATGLVTLNYASAGTAVLDVILTDHPSLTNTVRRWRINVEAGAAPAESIAGTMLDAYVDAPYWLNALGGEGLTFSRPDPSNYWTGNHSTGLPANITWGNVYAVGCPTTAGAYPYTARFNQWGRSTLSNTGTMNVLASPPCTVWNMADRAIDFATLRFLPGSAPMLTLQGLAETANGGFGFVRALNGYTSGKRYWEIRVDAVEGGTLASAISAGVDRSRYGRVTYFSSGGVESSTGYPAQWLSSDPTAGLYGYYSGRFQGGLSVQSFVAGMGTSNKPAAAVAAGQVLRFAHDVAAGALWVGIAGQGWIGGGNPETGAAPTLTGLVAEAGARFSEWKPFALLGGAGSRITANFGSQAWEGGGPPAGYSTIPFSKVAEFAGQVLDSDRMTFDSGTNTGSFIISGRSGGSIPEPRTYGSAVGFRGSLSGGVPVILGALPRSIGKWQVELRGYGFGEFTYFGLVPDDWDTQGGAAPGYTADSFGLRPKLTSGGTTAQVMNANTQVATPAADGIYTLALDLDASPKTVRVVRNGTTVGTYNLPATGKPWAFAIGGAGPGGIDVRTWDLAHPQAGFNNWTA